MRRNECLRYAAETGLEIVVDNYDHREWQCIARGLEKEPEKGLRCAYACSLFPGVTWWEMNWRKGGLQDRRNEIIREHGFYNQLYCGCEFSIASSPAMKDRDLI